VLIKLSGESLAGEGGAGVAAEAGGYVAGQIADAYEVCRQMGVVVGGGTLVRGARLAKAGMDRVRCDQAGMLGTALNAVVLGALLCARGLEARVYSAVPVGRLVRGMDLEEVRAGLERGEIAVFAGGTGNPFFTTDSAASLRALEIGAEVLLKATKVGGVYSGDPEKDPDAKRYERISFFEVLEQQLRVMDWTAVSLCMEHRLPIRVFDFEEPGALRRAVGGEDIGTLVY
jgi:uridylate kinase